VRREFACSCLPREAAVATTRAVTPDSRFFLRFIATGNTRIPMRELLREGASEP